MRALILAGGSGTRFWPLSRRDRPKQLLALDGERSLLQSTVDRLHPLIPASDIWVCTTERLADGVRAQLPEVPAEQVLCEPEGRNTAPAIGWSLQQMAGGGDLGGERDDIVAVLPADHRFANAGAFRDALAAAAEVSRQTDHVMTLGVQPRWAETGYGYLELGEPMSDAGGALELAQFREKPDAATAETYLNSGRHLWNAGIFVFGASTLLAFLRRFEPEIARGLDALRSPEAAEPSRAAEIYAGLPSISIDYAVMERLPEHRAISAVRLDAGWSDLGSWQALSEELPAGDDGNQVHGDVLTVDSDGNLLWADEGTIAVAGVSGLVVVRTGDAVLVVPKERSQDVKKIVEELKNRRRDDRL
ncbi:MAG: NTP transferase domain-containing protein [Thermoanaerobaculia bacterium]|nr:NTP transferase domain-containing protein [Thermoanaerobaculia bacterium]